MAPTKGSDDTAVSLGVSFDVGDDAVRDFERQLQKISAVTEKSFQNQRKARAAGGAFSPQFLAAAAEHKANVKLFKSTQAEIQKLKEEHERKTGPITQRAGGWVHRMLYGDKVRTSEDAEREDRKMRARMGGFQQTIHGALALSSHLARTLAPLPGGGMFHAAISGFASGAQSGAQTYDRERYEEGEKGTGVGRGMYALFHGLKSSLTSAVILGLAKGVTGAVTGSRTDEDLRLRLQQSAGGDLGGAGAAFRFALGGRGNPLAKADAGQIAAGVLAGGGGVGSMEAAVRAHASGQAGTFTSLLSGLTQTGGEGVDANAKKLWIDVLATGTAQGLQKGRVGELIVGAQIVAMQRAAGTTMGDPSAIFRFAADLGQNSAFVGKRGFETMGRLESFASGNSSPMARALSLMQSGLGGGVSMVEAMRRSEKGIFGEGGMGVEGVNSMISRVNKMAGGDRDNATLLLSKIAGLGVNEATGLLDLSKQGPLNQSALDRFKKDAMSDEERAYEAMANMNWKGIDKVLDSINSVLGNLAVKLGVLDGTMKLLNLTLSGLKKLSDFLSPNGSSDAAEAGMAVYAERQRIRGQGSRISDELLSQGNWGTTSRGTISGDVAKEDIEAAMRGMLGRNKVDKGANFNTAASVDKDQQFHHIIELRDSQGALIERMEGRQVLQSGMPHLRFSTLPGDTR